MRNEHTVLTGFMVKGLAMLAAAAIWLPSIHLLFKPDYEEFRSATSLWLPARQLAARHLAIWTDEELRRQELEKMQRANPEWDFMSRTYFVLSLANLAMADRSYQDEACEIMDFIIDNTLKIEQEKGFIHFILGYGRNDRWFVKPGRSLFVDGEISLMMAARRFVREKPEYRTALRERIELIIGQMRQSPVLSAESYPDECWLFCNAVSLAAVRMADLLDGTDHSDFLHDWVEVAAKKLTDNKTGILISAWGVDGTPAPAGYGPEGTSIWMGAHMLQVVDEPFADEQYRLAKKELGRSLLGFGYSREWPSSMPGGMDIDSGPVVPVIGLSASASGLALMAAAAFEDRDYFTRLVTSLNFSAFPSVKNGQLRYRASNPVGDAVLLYAMVEGPLWKAVKQRIGQGGPNGG
ncbi:MAG: hypothetical protein QGH40_00915 [bacterium]|nr:hypothetical protein [bacterium]